MPYEASNIPTMNVGQVQSVADVLKNFSMVIGSEFNTKPVDPIVMEPQYIAPTPAHRAPEASVDDVLKNFKMVIDSDVFPTGGAITWLDMPGGSVDPQTPTGIVGYDKPNIPMAGGGTTSAFNTGSGGGGGGVGQGAVTSAAQFAALCAKANGSPGNSSYGPVCKVPNGTCMVLNKGKVMQDSSGNVCLGVSGGAGGGGMGTVAIAAAAGLALLMFLR